MPLAEGALRPAAEIEHARETARLWHWRARTTLLADRVASSSCPSGGSRSSSSSQPPRCEITTRGCSPSRSAATSPRSAAAIRELSPDEHAEILSIAYERHRALNWLCRSGRGWALTPTDT